MMRTTTKTWDKINVEHVLISKLIFMTNSLHDSEDYPLPIGHSNFIGSGAVSFQKKSH